MRAVFFILMLLCSSGCSSLRALSSLKRYPDHVSLPISALAPDLPPSLLHDVRLDIRGRSYSMLGTVEIANDAMTLAAVTPIGGRLFVIRYDSETLAYEPSSVFDAPIRPERILLDFFLIYGRADALHAYGIDLRDDNNVRKAVTPDGEDVTILYTDPDHAWKSNVEYRNRSLGYGISIGPIAE